RPATSRLSRSFTWSPMKYGGSLSARRSEVIDRSISAVSAPSTRSRGSADTGATGAAEIRSSGGAGRRRSSVPDRGSDVLDPPFSVLGATPSEAAVFGLGDGVGVADFAVFAVA